MDKYKPGDVFISSLTQKVVIVEEDYSRDCHDRSCVYYNSICKYNKSDRIVEAGFCSGRNREDNISIYFKEISDLVLEIKDNSAIKKMENKQEGDVFISRLTGRKAITVLGKSSGRCWNCIYNRLGSKGGQIGCFGAYHDLRQKEVGQCSSKSRGDHKNVYFEEVEKTL